MLPILYGGELADDPKSYCKIKSRKDLVDSSFDVICMVPPLRNFTTRLFCRLIKTLDPDFAPSAEQMARLQDTHTGIINLILAHINKNGHEVGLRFKEVLLKELGPGQPKYTGEPQDREMKIHEFRRVIDH